MNLSKNTYSPAESSAKMPTNFWSMQCSLSGFTVTSFKLHFQKQCLMVSADTFFHTHFSQYITHNISTSAIISDAFFPSSSFIWKLLMVPKFEIFNNSSIQRLKMRDCTFWQEYQLDIREIRLQRFRILVFRNLVSVKSY